MGIRYYAYAFDADMTERAKADPRSFVSDDPLADAWGMSHGAQFAVTNFEQSVPDTEMLYLDKAWSWLQAMTEARATDAPARPAYRMFEGQVTMHGYGWIPWVWALSPEDVREIAGDLVDLQNELRVSRTVDRDTRYALDYLSRAVGFTVSLAASDRGFAYLIG